MALNPIIKFTTLFGLLAVPLGVKLNEKLGGVGALVIAFALLLISMYFVRRSFYGMRIQVGEQKE